MTKIQIVVLSALAAPLAGLTTLVALAPEDLAPGAAGLLGLAALSAAVLGAGLLGFGRLVHRRAAARARRHARRLAALAEMPSYS